MQITQLNESFDVTQYHLKSNAAMIELVAGNMVVKAQYVFFNAAGQQNGPVMSINMVVTQAQSDGIRNVLVNILQATNAAIETETGWTRYIEPEDQL